MRGVLWRRSGDTSDLSFGPRRTGFAAGNHWKRLDTGAGVGLSTELPCLIQSMGDPIGYLAANPGHRDGHPGSARLAGAEETLDKHPTFINNA